MSLRIITKDFLNHLLTGCQSWKNCSRLKLLLIHHSFPSLKCNQIVYETPESFTPYSHRDDKSLSFFLPLFCTDTFHTSTKIYCSLIYVPIAISPLQSPSQCIIASYEYACHFGCTVSTSRENTWYLLEHDRWTEWPRSSIKK